MLVFVKKNVMNDESYTDPQFFTVIHPTIEFIVLLMKQINIWPLA